MGARERATARSRYAKNRQESERVRTEGRRVHEPMRMQTNPRVPVLEPTEAPTVHLGRRTRT